jgi:hypothetical protein
MTAAWLARFAAEALAALQERERDPVGIAERAAIYAPRPRDPNPYTPETPDELRDGLQKGARS